MGCVKSGRLVACKHICAFIAIRTDHALQRPAKLRIAHACAANAEHAANSALRAYPFDYAAHAFRHFRYRPAVHIQGAEQACADYFPFQIHQHTFRFGSTAVYARNKFHFHSFRCA